MPTNLAVLEIYAAKFAQITFPTRFPQPEFLDSSPVFTTRIKFPKPTLAQSPPKTILPYLPGSRKRNHQLSRHAQTLDPGLATGPLMTTPRAAPREKPFLKIKISRILAAPARIYSNSPFPTSSPALFACLEHTAPSFQSHSQQPGPSRTAGPYDAGPWVEPDLNLPLDGGKQKLPGRILYGLSRYVPKLEKIGEHEWPIGP